MKPSSKVVVATSVALSFISFWRGASIVLCDLASSSFYAGGIAEKAIGTSAPWFVIGVMLFAFAVRSVYIESCSMFVRGGVYVVVRNSMGPFMARLSVSALVFDYVLTGPISGVSAGHYLAHLINELLSMVGITYLLPTKIFAMGFGVFVTGIFWRSNIKGMHESSTKALRIMQITSVMIVILLSWGLLTLFIKPGLSLPPLPLPENLNFQPSALGWLQGTTLPNMAMVGILIAFGHSFLSMSGFETLAQVYREIGHPKMQNLRRTGNTVCFYALVSTGLVTLLASVIIPADMHHLYYDNLIGGLAMNLSGPYVLRIFFHAFVVIVGVLILSGAINTSMIGSNGILNRVAEDGILTDWFRKPHTKFGTTSRLINCVAILQIGTILASMGDVETLGEAYAFGVVWSFFLKSLGVLVLRYQRKDQEYRTPLNIKIGAREYPVGLAITTLILFLVAITNLLTKEIATIYGLIFTITVFAAFTISERINRKSRCADKKTLEEFNLVHSSDIATENLHARPGCYLVAVRDYNRFQPLRVTLERTNLRRHDLVVMTVRVVTQLGEYEPSQDQLFTRYEQELFSRVVEAAEKQGKPVDLIVVPAIDPFDAMVQTAVKLKASRLILGVSANMSPDQLAHMVGLSWEKLPEPKFKFTLEVVSPDNPSHYFELGPHAPKISPEDIAMLHEIWLKLYDDGRFENNLHHRNILSMALRHIDRELKSERKEEVIHELSELHKEENTRVNPVVK